MFASEFHARRPSAIQLLSSLTVLAAAFLVPWGRLGGGGIVGDGAGSDADSSFAAATAASPSSVGTAADDTSTIDVHLGNGCFWERQWAYYVVETDPDGPFRRAPENVSSLVGYAGGDDPLADAQVCYHTGDDTRDYGALGYAETVRVTLDGASAAEQLTALARDFFGSFTGPSGARTRPDPGDVGSSYRSVFGLPGGTSSPLYAAFEGENAHGMDLLDEQPCGDRCGAPSENAVYVYDTASSPFRTAEAYHQFHCDFSLSAGMPYPPAYWRDLYQHMRDTGRVAPTGCPETGAGTLSHPGALCSA